MRVYNTSFTYVSPPISTAVDPMDFDDLRSGNVSPTQMYNNYFTGSDDTVDGSSRADVINGQGGSDALYGHGGNDAIYGETDPDSWVPATGVAASDQLYGQAGDDRLYGGIGNDILYGGSGADRLYGNNSNDSWAELGNDILYGGSGSDRLYGQRGDDVLVGGTGADWIYGGEGADRFVYSSAADTGDWVFDFVRGTDTLDLTVFDLDPLAFVGALAAAGEVGPGQVGYVTGYGPTNVETYLYVDTDGIAGADLEIRLIGVNQFAASDILW
jgi:Ca2+-binding RTX toxin-like protein